MFVCVSVCVFSVCGKGEDVVPLRTKKESFTHPYTHIHTRKWTVSADLENTLVYLLNYYNTFFFPKKGVLSGGMAN